MKKLLLITLILGSINFNTDWFDYFKADYFISATTGNDSNDGTAPWKAWATLSKVNSTTFSAGDRIAFNGEFTGTITVGQSGTAGNPITYKSYGDGATISGFTAVTGWTDEGGGIYSKVITSESQTNMVTVNGVNTGMGRFPNKGQAYLTYESYSTTVSITDNQLTGSPSWTGAEVVVRRNDWTWERLAISNHTTTTLTLTGSLYTGQNNNGYFFQNHLQTLDQLGEWYHDTGTGKFYMYFGANNPTDYVVKVATKNNLVTNNGKDYITFKNLQFEGSIDNSINETSQSNNLIVQNCEFKNSGSYAVWVDSYNSLIDNNTFWDCNQGAIRGADSLITITNNNINRSGLIIGASELYYNAIMTTVNDGGLIQYNVIDSSGGNGIRVNGTNVNVLNNFVNYSCLALNDFGGIYTTNDGAGAVGMLIDGNIVLNTIGHPQGGNTAAAIVHGIYLDNQSKNVTVTNNTSANNAWSGIFLNRANRNRIENNVCYDNAYGGIYLNNDVTNQNYLYDDTIRYNQFIGKTGDLAIYVRELNTTITDPTGLGLLNSNVYSVPIKDWKPILARYGGSEVYYSLAEWKTFSGMDASSTKAPYGIADDSEFQFEYNATKTAKTVSLDQPMIDLEGNYYESSVTLQPYRSIVLIPYIENIDLTTNLYAYYSLDDLTDEISSNRNPFNSNLSIDFTTGKFGNGAESNATGDYLRMAWATPPTDSLFTIAFKLKLNTLPSASGRSYGLCAETITGGTAIIWQLLITNGNALSYAQYNTANASHSTTTANHVVNKTGVWYDIVVTNSIATGKTNLYINGVQMATTQQTFEGANRTRNYRLYINNTAAFNIGTIGVIDEFGYWIGHLNRAQVSAYGNLTETYPFGN